MVVVSFEMRNLTNENKRIMMVLSQLISGRKEVLSKRLKTHYKHVHLSQASGLPEANVFAAESSSSPPYDYVCVIDFEATCTETRALDYPHEIIEFPLVLVNMRTLQIEDATSFYCRPTTNPLLTKFCTELTGITQVAIVVSVRVYFWSTTYI